MSLPFFSEPQSEKIGVLFFIGAARSPPRRVGSLPFFKETLFLRTGFFVFKRCGETSLIYFIQYSENPQPTTHNLHPNT